MQLIEQRFKYLNQLLLFRTEKKRKNRILYNFGLDFKKLVINIMKIEYNNPQKAEQHFKKSRELFKNKNHAQSLKEINKDWAEHWTEVEETLSWELLRVTLLPEGAYGRYMLEQQAAGADLAHLKPPQMKAADSIISRLLKPP